MSALANIINIAGIDSEDTILFLFHPKRRNQVKKVISEHNFRFGESTKDSGKILNYGLYDYKAERGGGDILFPVYARRRV